MRKNWIKSVGVELEGGIPDDVISKIRAWGADIGYDGSVYVENPFDDLDDDYWIPDAEIRFWDENPKIVLDFVKFVFDHDFVQDVSCGNHMHYKFYNQAIVIACISNINFVNDFVERYISVFGNSEYKYLARLENNYCRKYKDENDLDGNYCFEKRYRVINFDALHRHGTLEIRIMPYADNYEEYEKMFWFNYNTLNELISKYVKTIKIKESILPDVVVKPTFMSGVF